MQTVASLAENLKGARRREGLTQKELSLEAGVGVTTIARIEEAVITDPRVSTLRKLADTLGLEVRDLLPPLEEG